MKRMTIDEKFAACKCVDGPIEGSPCLIWPFGKFRDGYGAHRCGGRSQYAHRIAYEIKNGTVPEGLCVLHRCDNPGCVNADHLWLGTRTDNNRDRMNKDRGNTVRGDNHYSRMNPERLARGPRKNIERMARGEKSKSAKITEAMVVEIRNRYAVGDVSQRRLARECRITQAIVWQVLNHKTWKHVP